jgi:hypothetical protein
MALQRTAIPLRSIAAPVSTAIGPLKTKFLTFDVDVITMCLH